MSAIAWTAPFAWMKISLRLWTRILTAKIPVSWFAVKMVRPTVPSHFRPAPIITSVMIAIVSPIMAPIITPIIFMAVAAVMPIGIMAGRVSRIAAHAAAIMPMIISAMIILTGQAGIFCPLIHII